MASAFKVLVIRFSSIGDIVLTTPVVRNLKTQLDDAEVHFCTKKQYAGILQSNPYVDKVHVLSESLGQLIKELKAQKFTHIIDLHNNLRTRIIALRLPGAKVYRFNKINREKWLLVNFKINKLPNKHIVDRYMETVSPLGVKMDNLGLDYFVPEQDEVPLEVLPPTHRNGYVAYAIGAQHDTKKLPLSRMIELCDKIGRPVMLLGGKEDQQTGEEIANFFDDSGDDPATAKSLEALGKKTIIYNACGKYNLNQSAHLVKQANVVFTHDTGLMHIAAAFKKTIFSIWGNTVPEFGMYPYRTRFTVLQKQDLSCRPCSKIGFNKCPKGHFNCMNQIVFDFWLG